MGLGEPTRGTDDRHRDGDLPVPSGQPQPLDAERAATANNVGADLMISLRCENQLSAAPTGGVLSLRQLPWFGVDHRPQPRRLHPARSGGPHRFTRLPHARPDVGSATSDPDANGPGRHRLHHQPARPRDAGLHSRPAMPSPRNPCRRQAAVPAGQNDRPTGTFTFAELLAHELSVERTSQLGGS